MLVAITGATGFIGSAIVDAVLRAGHTVRVIRRPDRTADRPTWQLSSPVEVVAAALTDEAALTRAVSDVDAVVHVVAAMSGTREQQQAITVGGTEALVNAMRQGGVQHLIGISSFSVYDYATLADGAMLDEHCPVDPEPQRRDAYAHAKILQERLFRSFLEQPGHRGWILRPGIVYDRDRLWNFGLGRALGSRAWLMLGPDAEVPVVHVEDVADAVVKTLATQGSDETFAVNLVESPAPRRRSLLNALNAAAARPRRVLTLPWRLHRQLARLASAIDRLCGQCLRLPGLLRPIDLEARYRPLRYDNRRAATVLGWHPRHRAAEDLS